MKNFINHKNNKLFLFLIIILAALFLRYYNYNYQDFWWDELMDFSTSDPSLNLKETYNRAHNLTLGTTLSYDYATNANLYFYVYKFLLNLFSYTPGTARLITSSIGVMVFFLTIFLYNNFLGKNLILLSFLVSFNYYLVIQSQEFKYNIFFCFISLLSIFFFFLSTNSKNQKNNKIKFLNFIFLLLVMWTHIFGFLIFFSQVVSLYIKKKNYLLENIFYYISLPFFYIVINYKQLINFTKINEFHVPHKQIDFFFDYEFKYFFGSIISGKVFLITFLALFFFYFKKLFRNKFEISFLFILILISYSLPLIYSIISKPILETRYLIFIVPVIIMLLVFMIDLIKLKFLKNLIAFVLISISSLNTVYSLYILKKNDKPHISQVLSRINKTNNKDTIFVATSNYYLLNYLKKKNDFKKLNIKFISCEQSNSLMVKSYWEIVIFPGTRFTFCDKKLKKMGITSKDRVYKKKSEIIEKYARGKLIVFK